MSAFARTLQRHQAATERLDRHATELKQARELLDRLTKAHELIADLQGAAALVEQLRQMPPGIRLPLDERKILRRLEELEARVAKLES